MPRAGSEGAARVLAYHLLRHVKCLCILYAHTNLHAYAAGVIDATNRHGMCKVRVPTLGAMQDSMRTFLDTTGVALRILVRNVRSFRVCGAQLQQHVCVPSWKTYQCKGHATGLWTGLSPLSSWLWVNTTLLNSKCSCMCAIGDRPVPAQPC